MISYPTVKVKNELKVGVLFMSRDLNLFDNKIIILYVLENSAKSLTVNQIAKFCEEFDDITYFDICYYVQDLKDNKYIEEQVIENKALYNITEHGTNTLNELMELIPGVNLYNLKKMINKNIVQIKTSYSIDTKILPLKNDEFKISCYIKDGIDEMINITLYAGSKEQAKNIAKNWNNDAEHIYSKLLEMMTKDS